MNLIDTHCHLNFKAFAPLEKSGESHRRLGVVSAIDGVTTENQLLSLTGFAGDFLEVAKRAREAGIEAIIIPGSNAQTSRDAIEICRKINDSLGKKWAYAAVGIHPIHADNGKNFAKIEKLARMSEVVAIGECGVDKFHSVNEAEIAVQKELFARHIELAREVNKPIIIHNREADADVLEVLETFFSSQKLEKKSAKNSLSKPNSCSFFHDREKKNNLPKAVFHCFSSDWKFAQKVLELGAYISFTGNVTYGNKKIKKVIERVPLERVMIETDSPYLVPEPEKSSGVARNEPSYAWRIAKKIAEVKNLNLETVCSQTTENAKKFFGI